MLKRAPSIRPDGFHPDITNQHGLLDEFFTGMFLGSQTISVHTKKTNSRAVRRGLVDQVINQLRKLHVTETELLALKAIMALDPNVKGLSMKSSGHLLVGRESVQNALFAHLMTRHPASEATARFGHLLLLIASVTKVASAMTGLIQFSKDISLPVDPLLDELLLKDF
ncbi:Ligand-binding domain of nuclear hormone receptor [Ancylostoma ceylanicum]|uniref:Ligand-binding domain of nuclear hormone receptor n=1 Tax=Ancylostoma ceylanicum TaxID=53326 RepID=A0A0D6M7B2_9BILA|nr:Ligand-binding domain of nuclear hormone receptor [Ancylostoma ceylanicum]